MMGSGWKAQAAIRFDEPVAGHRVTDLQALWGSPKAPGDAGQGVYSVAGVQEPQAGWGHPSAAGPATARPGAWAPPPSPQNLQPSPPASTAPTAHGEDAPAWPLGRAVAQIQGVYILAENAHGLVIVDMHAAHERIVYERLKAQVDSSERIASQPLLIPATFAATPHEVATAEAQADTLAMLGLEIVPFSPKTLAVRAVPTSLAQGNAVEPGTQRARRVGGARRQHRGAARTQ